jgi:hypothetical protein
MANKRKSDDGIYLGTDTTGDIKNILAIIAQATEQERCEGMNWYFDAHKDAVEMAHDYNLDLWVVCQVLATISPQRRWTKNVKDTRTVLDAYKLAPELRIPYLLKVKIGGKNWNVFVRSWEILDGTRELTLKGSPKVYNFAMTILEPDTWMGVTVDSHAMALWSEQYHLTPGIYSCPIGLYRRISNDYTDVSAMLAILPSQAQAIAWTVRKRLMDSMTS